MKNKKIRPLYPIWNDTIESNERAMEAFSNLYHVTKTIIDTFPDKLNPKASQILKEALERYKKAFYGDDIRG